MKKLFTIAALVLVMSALMAGCSSKFTCDSCNKEVEGKKYTVEENGEEAELCEDCNKIYEAAKELAESLK